MRAVAAARPPGPPAVTASTTITTTTSCPIAAAAVHGRRTARQRRTLPPPPAALPPIRAPQSVTLVRHGQSTWNAAGIIQGSSNESVLTDKGRAQAAATRDALLGTPFDALIHSPLSRASETASIIWTGLRDSHPRCAGAPVVVSPSLREIDLHSFQGVVKAEGLASPALASAYAAWQADPAGFTIDGHWPVRDLWARAEEAWGEVLQAAAKGGSGGGAADPPTPTSTLVVAHNAVNQALLGVALGLPPSAFRRLAQANGGATEVRLVPPPGGRGRAPTPIPSPTSTASTSPPTACVARLNDRGPAAGPDLRPAKADKALVVLVAVGAGGSDAAAAVERALAGGGSDGGAADGRRWAALASRGAAAAAAPAAAAAARCLDLEGGRVEEVAGVAWDALATRAAVAAGASAAAATAATSLLVFALQAEVEAALASAAGLPPPAPGGVPPPFAAPAWSVSCVEVPATWAGGPAAVVRGTGWRGGGE